jgi:hypothetical protein
MEKLNSLRIELSVKAKNGIDFIFAATIIWVAITIIWTLGYNSFYKSILTLFATGPLFPLALAFSKLLKTNWKIKDNHLQPLGIWLNVAQFFYFPFLIFVLLKMPDYFVMTFAIITGAHFFPYSWFYRTKWYAIFAGIIVLGALLLGLYLEVGKIYIIPLFVSSMLVIMFFLLNHDVKIKSAWNNH